MKSLARALARALALASCLGLAAGMPAPPANAGEPVLPVAPEILEATPFRLQSPRVLPSGSSFDEGMVVVLRADPSLTAPRQSATPLLQCGSRLAFPASRGGDGVLVAILLGDVDLGSDLLFFGPPELPVRVTPEEARLRHERALAAGLRPAGPEAAARALATGAAPLELATFDDLAPFLVRLRCRIEPEALAAAGTPCPEAP